jgi:hypothetical protein
MRFHVKITTSLVTLATLVASFGAPQAALGEMTSTNYSIYADSVGFGGLNNSTSTSYTLSDTAGEAGAETATSTTYTLRGGFQAMEQDQTLSLTVSTSSLSLGTLSKTAVSNATTTFSVNTNSLTGYTVSISEVSGTSPATVSDGAVTAGADEYGVATVGDHGAISGEASVIAGRVLASFNNSTSGYATTTLVFRASYLTDSLAGSYSQTVSLIASANF